ncbi:MAG: hypothetical protein QNK37_30075 [Acidobacteriota bacterium]|nr:hypothetical protein [Acidobacteriota bacterium]
MRDNEPAPFPKPGWTWSIGIYFGKSLQELAPHEKAVNPVLHAERITGMHAAFVADPFIVREDHRFHMFFEVWNRERNRGEIGRATSPDGLRWTYEGVALAEAFHLSYPCVFADGDAWYMVPETLGAECVQLYRADPFPEKWKPVSPLIQGLHADPTLFRHDDLWWMLTCSRPWRHDILNLYWASTLKGPWREHVCSPLIDGDPSAARPGGPVIREEGHLIRFAQDCRPEYGSKLRAFRILALTREIYREEPLGEILRPGKDPWRRHGMHHAALCGLEDGGWLACVDGR